PLTIRFHSAPLSDREAAALKGRPLGPAHYDEVVGGEAADAYDEHGDVLFLYRHRHPRLTPEVCGPALPGLRRVADTSTREGGLLVFPQYRIAADVRDRDVILFPGGAWHGNTPIVGAEAGADHERISVVAYYRTRLIHCGSAAEEYEWAKRHELGDRLYD